MNSTTVLINLANAAYDGSAYERPASTQPTEAELAVRYRLHKHKQYSFMIELEMMCVENASLIERLKFVYGRNEFKRHDAPEDVLWDLNGAVTSLEDAISVALTFRMHLGDIAIARKRSSVIGSFVTLMDIILETDNQLLHRAFTACGFKRASEIDSRLLASVYYNDPFRMRFHPAGIVHSLELIKRRHAPIAEGLAQYFFHPDRIQAFLEAGHEMESYMC